MKCPQSYDFDRWNITGDLNDGDFLGTRKWRHYEKEVIPLWIADMDFKVSREVVAEIRRDIDHATLGYLDPPSELRRELVQRLDDQFGWKIKPDWLVFVPSLVPALTFSCAAYGQPGDRVVTFNPIYPPFFPAVKAAGRKLVRSPMHQTSSGHWHIDFHRLSRHLELGATLILFCNPHNPLGKVYSLEELEELADLAEHYDVPICSDELHCDLLFAPFSHHPMATISKKIASRLITLMGPSKAFNIGGMRCEFAIIQNPKLRRRFERGMEYKISEPNRLGFIAALAAYRFGAPWLAEVMVYLGDNRRLLLNHPLFKTGVGLSPIEGTYLAWLDFRQFFRSRVEKRLIEAAKVALVDGGEFGSPGFARLNFGCRRELLETALGRILKFIKKSK